MAVENGARCDSFNKQGQTPLHVLCTHGLAEEVERWRQMQRSAEAHAAQVEGADVDNEAEEEANENGEEEQESTVVSAALSDDARMEAEMDAILAVTPTFSPVDAAPK